MFLGNSPFQHQGFKRERQAHSRIRDTSFDEALPALRSSVSREEAAFSLFGSLWMSNGLE